MSVSTSLIIQAAMPGIGFAVFGFAWLYWGTSARAVAGAFFSLGVALLALLLLIVLVYGTPLVHALDDLIWGVLGGTLLLYAAALFGCVRLANASAPGVGAFGLLGLIPLWQVGGFVLMNAVCSFGTGGC